MVVTLLPFTTFAADDDGSAESDKAEITGISITVDGVTYTERNVFIKPDSTVSFIITGLNLQNVDQSRIIDTPVAYLPLHTIPLQEDGTYIFTASASVFVGGTQYNITYTNGSRVTSVDTDIFVTYIENHDCEYNDWIIGVRLLVQKMAASILNVLYTMRS